MTNSNNPEMNLPSSSLFLAIFRNEIKSILTPTTSGGSEWGRCRWARSLFWKSPITNPQCSIRICIRAYNTDCSFEPIVMKFTWLVRVLLWVNPIVFGNSWPYRTPDIGRNVPRNRFFGFHSAGMGVLRKKLRKLIRYPISHRKGYIHF